MPDEFHIPLHPTIDEQKDALKKGLGRAIIWAASGKLNLRLITEACLIDLRHDHQFEELRGNWLWKILEVSGHVYSIQQTLYESLSLVNQERNIHQHCELAYYYAKNGDVRFRDYLYEVVSKKPIDDTNLGEFQIMELDNLQGFQFAAEFREKLEKEEYGYWDDEMFIEKAEVFFDKAVIENTCVGKKYSRLLKVLDKRRIAESSKQEPNLNASKDCVCDISLETILESASNLNRSIPYRLWGNHASEYDINAISERIFTSNNEDEIGILLSVFAHRGLKSLDDRFVDLCYHENYTIRLRAISALENVNHPFLRNMAIENLCQKPSKVEYLGLFIKNYETGDEDFIINNLSLLDDDDAHSAFIDIKKIIEGNPACSSLKLTLLNYIKNPCSFCREGVVKFLLDSNLMPEWMKHECQYDCNRDIKELVKTY